MSSPHRNAAADENLTTVEGASGSIAWLIVENLDAAATVYVQIFAASDAVVGTDPPLLSIPCEPGVSGFSFGDKSIQIGNAGVHYAVTAGESNATAPPSGVRVNLGYG